MNASVSLSPKIEELLGPLKVVRFSDSLQYSEGREVDYTKASTYDHGLKVVGVYSQIILGFCLLDFEVRNHK